jgi:hypothetical protein
LLRDCQGPHRRANSVIGVGRFIRRPRLSVTLEELIVGGEQTTYLELRYSTAASCPASVTAASG